MNMGMEVFTIAGHDGGTWREITNDPPYPAMRFQNALAISGFMFWRLAERRLERELWGILHLSLDEEEFGITGLPHDWYSDNDFILDVLHGRDLCMTSSNSNETVLNIWTLPIADEGLKHNVGVAIRHPVLRFLPHDGPSSFQQRDHPVAR